MIRFLITILIVWFSFLPLQKNTTNDVVEAAFASTFLELLEPYPNLVKENFLFVPQSLSYSLFKDIQLDNGDVNLSQFKTSNRQSRSLEFLIPNFVDKEKQSQYLDLLKNDSDDFWISMRKDSDYFGTVRMTEPMINGNSAFVVLSFQWGPRNGFVQWFKLKKLKDKWVVKNKEITIEF